MQGDFADGVDVRVRRAQRSSTDTPPRSPTVRPHSRASSSRGRMPAETMIMSTSSVSPSANSIRSTQLSPRTCFVRFVEVNLDAELFDLFHQRPRAGIVDLPWHQPRRELDDVRFQAEIERRLRRLQAQQPAADHRAALRPLAVGDDPFQIFDRAIDEHARQLNPLDRRHERITSRSPARRRRIRSSPPCRKYDRRRSRSILFARSPRCNSTPFSRYQSSRAIISFSASRWAKNDVSPTRS